MNYNQRKRQNKKPWLTIVLLILLAAAIFAFLELKGITHFVRKKPAPTTQNQGETINYTPTTQEEQKQIDDSKTNPDNIPKEQDPNPEPTTPIVTITSAKQQASEVVITTELQGAGWKSCKLTLTQGSNTVTKTAEAIYQTQFSTCAGFSVPTSELANGEWSASLLATRIDGSSVVSKSVSFSVVK